MFNNLIVKNKPEYLKFVARFVINTIQNLMQVIRFKKQDQQLFSSCVLTIGTFDGLHRGHRKIIEILKDKAKEHNCPSVMLSFDPHPRIVLDQDKKAVSTILTTEEKSELLEKMGLDYFVIMPFTLDFAQLHPADYIENYILKYFNPKAIITGEDHRFGANAMGNTGFFREYSEKNNFELIEVQKILEQSLKISSSSIRNLVQQNEFGKVRELLGYPFYFKGRVTDGNKLGRQMGYPTANLEILDDHKLMPNDGIYSAIGIIDGKEYNAMLYIGNRPTMGDNLKRSCEVHLFEFNQDLYSQSLEVQVIEYLREDRKFDNMDSLKVQIEEDEERSKNSLLRYSLTSHFEKFKAVTAVVILNYNGIEHLKSYLPSLLKYKPADINLYVVDNASTDNSVLFLERNFPEVNLIELKKNYGYAQGYNKGLAQIEADYYILVNSDIEVNSHWIEPLIAAIRSGKDVAAVQPKIKAISKPEYFEYAGAAGGHIDVLGFPFCEGRVIQEIEKDEGQYNVPKEIFWASGAAFIVNAKLFSAIGGFDKDYFAHQEEIDLCWRIKRAGFKVLYEPKSEVFHLGGGSLNYESPKKTYLNFRNNLTTIFKNVPWIYLPFLLIARLVIDCVIFLLWIFQGKWVYSTKIIKAYFVSMLRTPFLLQKKYDNDIQVENCQINESNMKGLFKGSVLLQYYLFNHRKSSDLSKEYFN